MIFILFRVWDSWQDDKYTYVIIEAITNTYSTLKLSRIKHDSD